MGGTKCTTIKIRSADEDQTAMALFVKKRVWQIKVFVQSLIIAVVCRSAVATVTLWFFTSAVSPAELYSLFCSYCSE